ncbi:hypothetical protein TGDOM2_266372 [Toxoplasma gondii GAB2-2007-GAL-DOM2]|uniref:Uncharacterized protein n=3 Tax=Toxoplasma gondii TaxID=5811 RepID=S7UGD9_TOXGG|nr:hypothetical protein TGGT1_266372 [Toxoplasma gondii GT1]KFG38722.1 hypothetical protein TGDOM2_266372 [Toxoplasma gondii GAB2-2007-GAL-DOM2]RQX74087.1 hypothetical protein TGCAST_266372 [Toxoplasma gondii CAST]
MPAWRVACAGRRGRQQETQGDERAETEDRQRRERMLEDRGKKKRAKTVSWEKCSRQLLSLEQQMTESESFFEQRRCDDKQDYQEEGSDAVSEVYIHPSSHLRQLPSRVASPVSLCPSSTSRSSSPASLTSTPSAFPESSSLFSSNRSAHSAPPLSSSSRSLSPSSHWRSPTNCYPHPSVSSVPSLSSPPPFSSPSVSAVHSPSSLLSRTLALLLLLFSASPLPPSACLASSPLPVWQAFSASISPRCGLGPAVSLSSFPAFSSLRRRCRRVSSGGCASPVESPSETHAPINFVSPFHNSFSPPQPFRWWLATPGRRKSLLFCSFLFSPHTLVSPCSPLLSLSSSSLFSPFSPFSPFSLLSFPTPPPQFSSVSPSTSSPLPASLQRSQTHTEETAHAKRPKGQRNFGFTRIRCLGKPFARAVHTPGTSPLHSLARKSEDEQQQSGGLQATFFNSLFSFGTRAHEDREAQKAREASEEESEESAAEPENAPTAERAAEGGQTEEELPGRRLTRGKGRQQTKQKSREESQEKARDGSESKSGKNFGETSREKTRRNYAEKSEGKPDKMSRDKAEKTSEKTSAEKAAEKECGSRGEQKGAETNVETTEEKSEKTENRLQGDTSESTEPGERKRRKPWNYGRPWTEEIRLKIAARTRLAMQRLKSERAAAKTDDGEAISRTPSAAKRAPLSSAARLKLSERLRARWRDPEARLKLLQLGRERTQSEATRAAIAESVRRKWREDPGYAERVREGHAKVNAAGEKRKKISETLKRLWRDEAFRHRMRTTRRPYTEERRRALSAKITAMWAERTDYRSRTVDAIRSRFDRLKVESFTRRLGAGKIPTQRVFSHFAANTPAGGPHAPDLFSILGVKQAKLFPLQPPHSQRQEFWQRMYQKLLSAEQEESAGSPTDENRGSQEPRKEE